MKISWRWLGRHVDLEGLSPQKVVEDLTLSVAEVEGLERFAPALSAVSVGAVLAREKHPDADKLSVCRVDVGSGELLQIVCGASNVAAGQKVAVALAGTSLPGEVKIKKSKIRGVESQGMICSERELGIGDEHEGIWVLPSDAPLGKPVGSALGLADWVIEVDNKSITHRPDLWGHRGFAAEIAAICRRKLVPLDLSMPAARTGERFPVRIESNACSRYVAQPIDSLRAAKSPDWLRYLLLATGQRPIDLLVDLSNFVMLDLGQPCHVFDRDRLPAGEITVRTARDGERFTTLDAAERVLTSSDLLITSGGEPVALAGVMGGARSKVDASTRRVVLEAATFDAAAVRRTAARLALRTDASARFEKSLDPLMPPRAAGHFARMLQEIQPNIELPSPPTDVGNWKDPARTLELRGARVRSVLGVDIADAQITDILERLDFRVEPAGEGSLSVRVPSARATKDIQGEHDLIEEVGRLWRYGNVPEAKLVAVIEPPPCDERREIVRRIEDRLGGGGRFHQTISHSLLGEALLKTLGMEVLRHVRVVNPIAEGMSRVRRSVVPSLLALLEKNRRHREEIRLFEIGKGYLPECANARGEPLEVHELGLVWARVREAEGERFDAGAAARLQGAVDDLVRALGRQALAWDALHADARPAWVHPARGLEGRAPDGGADIDGERVAVLGPLDPGVARRLGLVRELACEVAVCAVSIDELLKAPRAESVFRPLPPHPPTKLDVALAVPSEVPAHAVRAAIERAGKGQVANAELFDRFSGGQLGIGRKSLAWHVVLQDPERTLGEEATQKFLGRLEREVQGLGGELRRA